jgi:GxxExxY protein
MQILTTEAQRDREDREQRDPRTTSIIGAAIEVHRCLGPGLLESAYEECLCHELYLRGLSFERQVDLPVSYKGLMLGCGYKIDLIVQQVVVLELKAIEKLRGTASHLSQTLRKARRPPDQFQYSAIDQWG